LITQRSSVRVRPPQLSSANKAFLLECLIYLYHIKNRWDHGSYRNPEGLPFKHKDGSPKHKREKAVLKQPFH
ncbi:MAG TPA: hypothetical protein DHW31_02460, partial [Bacteroides graminisolvens]|nr:hypothetical protein [Bacteroides graminisolvens]